MTRAETLRRVQGPYLGATVLLALGGLLGLFLGPKGQVNWWATALLMLAPLADALRCVAVYRQQDEYGQTLMLRSAALAFAGVMGALLALSLLSSARGSADFAAGTMVGVYVAGYGTFLLTQTVLARREAQE
ncbi:hypothetical protein [Deinococcus gobiensis]|uniref:DUF2178 domain-containing protein n=1 Tax=Deinococcus gobiensis (strain DSM 21396 / JCM 16679 / CGMCC 1.7299 / I-0) TaxID=745776 RepID=H8GTW3_DEIGI|nr:hypothetical protein [Deinococcus gobiensis]AFD26603.1 hypothetical protein DGo_CA2676 [Deinococcus gobiensis I-0]